MSKKNVITLRNGYILVALLVAWLWIDVSMDRYHCLTSRLSKKLVQHIFKFFLKCGRMEKNDTCAVKRFCLVFKSYIFSVIQTLVVSNKKTVEDVIQKISSST